MAILLAAVVALVPLLIAPGLLFSYDVTPKVAVLLLGAVLSLAWFAWRGDGLGPLLASRAGRWLCVLLAVQGASLALSTALSANPALSLGGTNWRRFGAITQGGLLVFTLLAAAHAARNRGRVRRLLRVIGASGAPVALYGLLQYFGWDPWLPAEAYHAGEGSLAIVRPPGTLGHAGYFATYCLYVAFAGAGLAIAERGWWKSLGLIAAALGSAAILLSGTRAAILGLLAGAAALMMCLPARLRLRALAAGGALMAAVTLFYFSPPGWKLRSRMSWSVEDPFGGARLLLWRDSLRLGADRWATGSGPETFSSRFPPFQSAALSRAYPDFYHESPHNIYLDAFAAQGLPGVATLLLLSGLGVHAAWSARSRQPALAAALIAGIASQQFTSFTLPTALFFYLTAALAVACSASAHVAGSQTRSSPRVVPKLVAVAAGVLMASFAVRLFVADHALAGVKRDLETGNLTRAVENYQRVQRWQPAGGSADLWFSRRLGSALGQSSDLLARLQASRVVLDSAIRATGNAEDRHNAWYSLAALYANQNDFARTEESLRAAIRCAPNWFKPHWMLARVLRAAGRLEEAAGEAAIAAELNGGKDAEVVRTLEELRSK